MIASKVEKVYDLYFPAEVRGLLQAFTILFSFGMEGVPLECLGATGYERKLVMWCAEATICLDLATSEHCTSASASATRAQVDGSPLVCAGC